MDALKIIPQMFFDVIARLFPGGVMVIALDYAIQFNILTSVINSIVPDPELKKSTFVWATIIISVSYLIGQLLSPLSEFVAGATIHRFFSPAGEQELLEVNNGNFKNSNYPPVVQSFLATETDGATDKQYRSAIFVWSDWLRLNYPEAGSYVAKIRAEYSMCAAISSAGMIALLLHLLVNTYKSLNGNTLGWKPSFIIIAIASTLLTLWRYKTLFDISQKSTINLYYVGKSSKQNQKLPDNVKFQETNAHSHEI